MDSKQTVTKWFKCWEEGNFLDLPISENFIHTSPYGTTKGKETYLRLVAANKDKFLGHRFEIHDLLFDQDRACIRYTATQENFSLEVSEWHFVSDGIIEKIVAYYNIEEERIEIEE